jgi:hypothetical protein
MVPTTRSLTGGDGILIAGVSTAQNLSANRTITVDSTVVRTTGNQTIGGTKTFSSAISGSITGDIVGSRFSSSGNQTPAFFGDSRLTMRMLELSIPGSGRITNPGQFQDIIYVKAASAATGATAGNALIFGLSGDWIGFSRQNHNSSTWGTPREIIHTGNASIQFRRTLGYNANFSTLLPDGISIGANNAASVNSGRVYAYKFLVSGTASGQSLILQRITNGGDWVEYMSFSGTSSPEVIITGDFLVDGSKNFYITHPTKPNMKLKHGSLEGPENGVYIRGRLTNNTVIELPDYWVGLVDETTITAQLTSIGSHQNIFIEKIENNKVYVGGNPSDFYYNIYGERKDIKKLEVEIPI